MALDRLNDEKEMLKERVSRRQGSPEETRRLKQAEFITEKKLKIAREIPENN